MFSSAADTAWASILLVAGAGAAFTLEGLGLRADYSYSDYGTLGGSHRIGIGVSF
jgi:hypothetical protein